MRETTQYLPFCDWLLSPAQCPQGSSMSLLCQNSLNFIRLKNIPWYGWSTFRLPIICSRPLRLRPPSGGCELRGCEHGCTNIPHVSAFNSLGCKTVGAHGNSMLNFFRNCHYFSQQLHHLTHPAITPSLPIFLLGAHLLA